MTGRTTPGQLQRESFGSAGDLAPRIVAGQFGQRAVDGDEEQAPRAQRREPQRLAAIGRGAPDHRLRQPSDHGCVLSDQQQPVIATTPDYVPVHVHGVLVSVCS